MDLAVIPFWLFTLESELKGFTYEPPATTRLFHGPVLTSSLSAGAHLRTRDFEIGVLAGVGESPYIVASPSPVAITVSNILLPHLGGRLSYNLRLNKTNYVRGEVTFLKEFAGGNVAGTFQVQGAQRVAFNTHWGFLQSSSWLRFTLGGSIQETLSNLGRQRAVMIHMGVSIGNIWGQRPPISR